MAPQWAIPFACRQVPALTARGEWPTCLGNALVVGPLDSRYGVVACKPAPGSHQRRRLTADGESTIGPVLFKDICNARRVSPAGMGFVDREWTAAMAVYLWRDAAPHMGGGQPSWEAAGPPAPTVAQGIDEIQPGRRWPASCGHERFPKLWSAAFRKSSWIRRLPEGSRCTQSSWCLPQLLGPSPEPHRVRLSKAEAAHRK